MFGTARGWICIGLGLWSAAARAETVSLSLRDGSVLRGEILARTDSTVTIRNAVLGEVSVPRRDLVPEAGAKPDRIPDSARAARSPAVLHEPVGRPPAAPSDPERMGSSPAADPSDQALFFMPTAFLPPPRAFTFRDFELLFMTFGYSPGARTALTAGFLFPITSAVQVITGGVKQNLWADGSGAAVSITGNLTEPLGDLNDDLGVFANSNLVASKRFVDAAGEMAYGVHGAVGYLGHEEKTTHYDPIGDGETKVAHWTGGFDFGLGFEAAMTPHAKFLIEYVSASPFASEDSFKGGLLTFGLRLHGERLSADIAGVRPFISNGLDELILWPLLVVSYRI